MWASTCRCFNAHVEKRRLGFTIRTGWVKSPHPSTCHPVYNLTEWNLHTSQPATRYTIWLSEISTPLNLPPGIQSDWVKFAHFSTCHPVYNLAEWNLHTSQPATQCTIWLSEICIPPNLPPSVQSGWVKCAHFSTCHPVYSLAEWNVHTSQPATQCTVWLSEICTPLWETQCKNKSVTTIKTIRMKPSKLQTCKNTQCRLYNTPG